MVILSSTLALFLECTGRDPCRFLKSRIERVPCGESRQQPDGLHGQLFCFPFSDQVFRMPYPPLISVVVERLLLHFPEIIGQVVGWNIGQFCHIGQVAIVLQIRLQPLHTVIRCCTDLLQVCCLVVRFCRRFPVRERSGFILRRFRRIGSRWKLLKGGFISACARDPGMTEIIMPFSERKRNI